MSEELGFDVVTTCYGAVDDSEIFAEEDYQKAEEYAEKQVEELGKSDCQEWEVHICVVYIGEYVIEGSQWGGDEPKLIGSSPRPACGHSFADLEMKDFGEFYCPTCEAFVEV